MSISEQCFLYSGCLKPAAGIPAETESLAVFFCKMVQTFIYFI